MRVGQHGILRLAAAISVALPVVLLSSRASVAAPARASLPVLHLSYFEGSAGQLAGTLDPAQAGGEQDLELGLMLNRGLVAIGTNDKVVPELATHWKVSKNAKTYTFFMRHNARFSNGDPVTAQDVVWSIRRALAPSTKSGLDYYDQLIAGYTAYTAGTSKKLGVKALDKYTVQVKLSQSAAYFLMSFTSPMNFALDPKVEKGHEAGPTNNYMDQTCAANVGSGPFKFVCRNKSSDPTSFYPAGQTPSYTLVPNKYFWGKKPQIQVQVPSSGSADQYYDKYLANQADMTSIPTADLESWINKKSKQLHTALTSIIDYIIVGNKTAPFNNINCRRAFAWGVDRNAIADILHQSVVPLYTIVPKHFLGYWNGTGVPHYNLAKAKQYFAQCPGKDTPVTYTYQLGSTDGNNVATAIGNMLSQVGFKSNIKGLTSSAILQSPFSENGIQAARNGWAQDYPDPQDYTSLLLQCGAHYDTGEFCNKKFDSLTKRADRDTNDKTRAQLYVQAQKIALNNVGIIPYDNRIERFLLKTYVHGMTLTIAYADWMPKNLDWSQVTISKH